MPHSHDTKIRPEQNRPPAEIAVSDGENSENNTHYVGPHSDISAMPAADVGGNESMSSFLLVLTMLSAIGGFLFGYDTGVVSGAMILLKEHFRMSTGMQELIVSITIAGAAVFAFVGGWLNNKWGRKPVILLASIIFTCGAAVMAVAWAAWVLLAGRLIVGIGIGNAYAR